MMTLGSLMGQCYQCYVSFIYQLVYHGSVDFSGSYFQHNFVFKSMYGNLIILPLNRNEIVNLKSFLFCFKLEKSFFGLIIADGSAWNYEKVDSFYLDGGALGEDVEPGNFDHQFRNFTVDAFDWKTLKKGLQYMSENRTSKIWIYPKSGCSGVRILDK